MEYRALWINLIIACRGHLVLIMPRRDEATLSIHGLDMDARVVRADVFVQKLRDLLSAFKAADKLANGKSTHDYMLSKLYDGSAVATVRERPRKRGVSQSSIACFERVATAVYNGDRHEVGALDPAIVRKIEKLSQGASERFSHAEISFADDKVIRIDDYLQHQAEDALLVPINAPVDEPQAYKGAAFGAFEGVLKEIDSRGTMLRGKLVLEPSSTEIDCVMNKDRVPEARESFDSRVTIKATAHYDGRSNLPARLDVHEIRAISQEGNLARWKGAFVFPETDDIEDY